MSFAYSAFHHFWISSYSLSFHSPCTEHMDLEGNDLGGLLPTELGLMTALTYLGLSYNTFSSEIPTEIGNMTSLMHFDVRSNTMTGLCPQSLDC